MNRFVTFMRSWLAALIAAFFVIVWPWLSEFAGRFEGDYFPVTPHIEVSIASKYGEFSTVIYGRFYISRDCDFAGLAFSTGPRGTGVDVPLKFLETAKKRGIGWHDFGPWVVDVHPYEFKRMTFAESRHSCHAFFDTISHFYP